MRRYLLGLLALLALAPEARAGWLLAPGVKWGTFSARPEGDEATPNYQGYGGGLSLGYSFGQVADFALYGHYLPGKVGVAAPGKEDASFHSYGGEFALRFARTIYFGMRGGLASYKLVRATRDDEISGRWSGPAGGISIGAYTALSKRSFLQTTFDVMHAVVEAETEGDGKRRFDSFAITVSYVFNGFKSHLIESNLFEGFLDSILFY